MAVKYVKDFFFGPMTSVQRYAKGGHVTKIPAKAAASAKGMPAKAKPNAPATGAKRMESPPTVGKGQGYAKGGKAMPAKAKASAKGMPAKAKPNAAPSGAKRMESPPSRGKRQGYAEGGSVPGKKMDRLPTDSPPGRDYDLAPSKPFKGEYEGYAKGGRMRRYAEGGDIKDPRAMSIEPGDGAPRVQYNQYGEADPFEGRPVRYEGALERLPLVPDESQPFAPPPRPLVYEGTGPAAQAFMDREQAMRDAIARTGAPSTLTEATFPVAAAQELKRPEPNDNAWFDSLLRLAQQEQARPARGYLNAEEGLSGIGRAMREGAMRADMMRRPGMPGERTAMYAKGGQVKGQAKVGKVMSEYKAGELHSGSKKGPLVKNPKQAVAIALSEARKAGAKIPKKAEGGAMDSYGDKKEPYRGPPKPKSVSVTKVTKTVSDGKDAMKNEEIIRRLMDQLRRESSISYQSDAEAKALEDRAMQAPSMDPDMPKYRKGGMARKGVPAHKAKAMYGGGKC